jgi:hypothetical protein
MAFTTGRNMLHDILRLAYTGRDVQALIGAFTTSGLCSLIRALKSHPVSPCTTSEVTRTAYISFAFTLAEAGSCWPRMLLIFMATWTSATLIRFCTALATVARV